MKEATARIKINKLLEAAGWRFFPDPKRLVDEAVGDDYIVLTQRPSYANEAGWKNEAERPDYIQVNKLRFLRPYATNNQVRHIIDSREYTDLATNPVFSSKDMKAVPEKYRTIIPSYIKDYVSLNQFTS